MHLVYETDEKFRKMAKTYADAASSSYRTAQLEFWEQGLNLISPANPEQCPFCEEETITPEKIQGLKDRIEVDQNLSKAHSSFNHETDQYIDIFSQLESRILQLEFRAISTEDLSTLEKLFERDKEQLQTFANENRLGVRRIQELREEITQIKSALSTLKISITQPDMVLGAIDTVSNITTRVEGKLEFVAESLKKYNETFSTFRPIFERELSDEETVAKFTYLIDLLGNYSSVRLFAKAEAFDNEILEVQRLVDGYILTQQKSALASREADILNWYSLLSPNPDVKFSGLEPGRNEFGLKAEAFGKKMNAAAALSQSQLNCLGLSIYIPSVSAIDSPFKFILFDDPVQAMDDDHHEAFLLKVVPELIHTCGFQVIVLTHLKETADKLRDNNFSSDFTYYRFDKLQASGPEIAEYIVLSDDLKKIRTLAQGNDDSRQMAVDRVRVLCENIMREAYLHHMGSRMPVGRGTASAMIPYFAKIPSVKPTMVADIQDTINWSNPAHHTQPGYVIPCAANITPHIERLQRLVDTLGLKKK